MPLAFSLENASYLATIVTSGIAGIWVLLTWRHREQLRKDKEALRKDKENPGIEIGFACRQDPLPNGRVLLTINYTVRNTGVLPIHPKITEARYRVGLIPLESANGFLAQDVPPIAGKVEEIPCMPHRKGLRLEPKTKTIFTAQYFATPGHLYAVEFILPSKDLDELGEPWVWRKWRAVFVSNREADRDEHKSGIKENARRDHRVSGN